MRDEVGAGGFEHVPDGGDGQAGDLDQGADHPQPVDVRLVVARLVGAGALAGLEETFAQVVLDRRHGHTRPATQFRHAHPVAPPVGAMPDCIHRMDSVHIDSRQQRYP
ncbi:hypothetical protein GCM10029964_112650 [Kibdelosporangium lantanae]